MADKQLSKKTRDRWRWKKIFLWIIGDIIILALILYYVVSKNERNIELITFVASISSIVLAISSIIIGKSYNKDTGDVLEHIELLVEDISDELQHRLNSLEDIKISLEKLPENMPEKKDLLDKVEKMEDVIMTSPLLASERSRHEDNKIRIYEKKIRSGKRKLFRYNNNLNDNISEKEKIKIQNKTIIREEKIKLADKKLKEITDK